MKELVIDRVRKQRKSLGSGKTQKNDDQFQFGNQSVLTGSHLADGKLLKVHKR